jgi:hypothetical protein
MRPTFVSSSETSRKKNVHFRFLLSIVLMIAASMMPAAIAAQSYTWQNVRIIGGGYVDGIIAHPSQKNLFYARTDVGGAYRYDSSKSQWTPLLDWTTPANATQSGVDSIAVDPNNTEMLYMTIGEYATESWAGNGAFLVSSDQGASFYTISLPFHVGANENGRNGGERLQVDPNEGNILFLGTYLNGLYKSTDGGWDWSQVTSFPVTSTSSGAGVIWVAFDKSSGSGGAATPVVFAAVSTTGTSLYMSSDGGSSWSSVSNAPTGYYPTRGLIGPDHCLYITYGDAIGPNSMQNGSVWKYDISKETWTNITPYDSYYSAYGEYYGFSGLALDPQVSGSLLVTSMDRWWPTDTMWRSTNGGQSWTDVGSISSRDASLAPWTSYGNSTPPFGGWPSAVVIDPFNSDHAMYDGDNSIWVTSNLTNSSGPSWTIGALGIEETAVEQLVSPTSGATLVSALGDICGFVHTSLTSSPSSGYEQNPKMNTCTSVAVAKNSPYTVVRVGYGASTYGSISTNQGSSWTAFGSSAGSSSGGGSVAISADAQVIVWAPSDTTPSYSVKPNRGSSWTSLSSYLPEGVTVMADGYNANIFYAYDPSTGNFYASTNKAASWYKAYSNLPTYGNPTAVTGVQGEIWLATSSGLYHSKDSGSSWSTLSNVSSALAIGTGVSASGSSYKTLYLSGTVSGAAGIFRSTNNGSSWVQINDSAHQWGGANVIVGDQQTFGTVYIGTQGGRGIIYGTSSN